MALRLPYIQVTQEAWDYARQLAALSGRSEGDSFLAVVNLWRWGLSLGPEDQPPAGVCDSPRADRLLLANLGSGWAPETVDVLADLQLVERTETGIRVRGMDRYRRTWEKNRRRKPAGSVPVTGTKPAPAAPEPAPQTQTQTQTQIENQKLVVKEAPPPAPVERLPGPVVIEAPKTSPDTWTGEEFWRWAQSRRQASGLVAERARPRDLGSWFSAALMTPGVTVRALQEAFYRFGESKHWGGTTPPYPFRGFVSQWDQFMPEVGRAANRS